MTKSKPIPAYQRIKQAILDNIHQGTWAAGTAISTEMALAEEFGVSRMTVNRALKELSEERVLERRQGSGTFVAQQHFNHTFVEVRNIAEDLKSANRVYKAEVIAKRTLTKAMLSESLRQRFHISDKAKGKKAKQTEATAAEAVLYEVKILHIADGEPIQLEERWVDAKRLPQFIEQDFTEVNTSDYLIAKIPLERGSYTISAQPAKDEIAEALQIPEGSPALVLCRQTYSAGQTVTVVRMWHAGDRYQFTGEL